MVRVLLLEDQPVQLQAREAVLTTAGFTVTSTKTADEALVFLRADASARGSEQFRVVITDHLLPDASGLALVREVRAANPEIPIIVVSGMAEVESEYRELNVTFLQKPCPPEDLVRAVQNSVNL